MLIAYKENNQVKIIIPVININIKVIADKDVPANLPYKILNNDTPNVPQEYWELDLTNADGIGLTKEEFDKKYPEYSGWAVK